MRRQIAAVLRLLLLTSSDLCATILQRPIRSSPRAALTRLGVRVQESSPDLKTGARAAPSDVAIARDGTRLAYTLEGKAHGGAASRIVLIHSLAMDRLFWQPVVERLTDHAAVL